MLVLESLALLTLVVMVFDHVHEQKMRRKRIMFARR